MKKNINILFLGGSKRVSLAEKFIQTGFENDINIKIFSYELDFNVPISFVAEIIIGLKWSDINLYEHLKEVITKNQIDIILPFLDYTTIVAASLKKIKFNKKVFIPVSNIKQCKLFINKKLVNNWCIKNNIKVPSNNNKFPLIAKPVNGSASKGIIILRNQNEFNSLKDKSKFFVQEYITGEEYSVDIYVSCIDEKIISVVPRIRIETQGGESIKSITVKDRKIIDFSIDIIKKSSLIGPLTLQVIKEKETNELYFIEINPRFGGAVLNSIYSGANSTQYILNDFFKVNNSYFEEWQDGILMIRRFSEFYKLCK